ncbi:MAG: GxxExxY protein [Armatimonadetes bacterium]|nr:GxxExxY protein [Armatimonadota bacterium]
MGVVDDLWPELSGEIIGCAFEVHSALGPGLLESAYKECLFHELAMHGLQVAKEVSLPVVYKGVALDCGYRLDLVVEDKVIIELKAVEALRPVHEAQLLSYLKLSGLRLGLLMNFNVVRLREGIKRRVL